MTWGDYYRVCLGEVKREQNIIRHTRLILGALVHKDPREIIPLKGDYDNLQARSQAEIEEILTKWGMTKWLEHGKSS